MKIFYKLVYLPLIPWFCFTGCTHQLRIKNLSAYYNTSSVAIDHPLRVGLRVNATDFQGRQLAKLTADALAKYNIQVTTGIVRGNSNVDVLATMSVNSSYKGSGWNFLINFPGFLLWAPAWNGYIYNVSHDIRVVFYDVNTQKVLASVDIPAVFDIRHADINRTWTEISWLEVGVIAFIGGLVFVNYDNSITPMVTEKAGLILADYIAQEIAYSLSDIKPSRKWVSSSERTVDPKTGEESAKEKLMALQQMLEKELLTQEEYDSHRQLILSGMAQSFAPTDTDETLYKISDFRIVEYRFDARSGKGEITVDVSGKGFNARLWVIKNIGMICSSKNVALSAGNEAFAGARYSILDESLKDGLLTVVFSVFY